MCIYGVKKMVRLKASFTIEAAMIVPLSMFVMVTFIYMAFYIHDRAVMGSAGADYILENAADYTQSLAAIETDTEQMLESCLIAADDVSVNVSSGSAVSLESSALFSVPFGFVTKLAGGISECLSTSVNISMLDARGILLEYKAAADGAENISQSLTQEGEE